MKKFIALLSALILTFACTTFCFAAQSPIATPLPTEDTTEGGGGETTSPQTGLPIAGALVATITSAGLAVVAKKEMK